MKPLKNNTGKPEQIFTFGNPTEIVEEMSFEVEVSVTLAGRIVAYQHSHMAVVSDDAPEEMRKPGDIWQIVLESGLIITSNYNAFPDLLRWDADLIDCQWVVLHVHMSPQGAILDPIEQQEWAR